MAGYTRQSEAGIVDGGIISADDLNNEFDQIETAMGAGGHSHSGVAGEGPQITSAGLATGSVVAAKLAPSAVETDKIADLAVTTAKIKAGDVTKAKMAPDSVGANELDETESYTVAGLTINSGTLVFEGATENDFETTISVTDPTQDRTITIPDATTTMVGTDVSQTLTNKSISLTDNTLSGTLAEFNTAVSDDDLVSLTGTETLTNKTLTSPYINQILHEGTEDAYEMTLAFTDPTNDHTITFPDSTGTVALTSDITLSTLSVTSTAAELNVLDGIPATLTATELGYVDGVTSAIQTQIDSKQATITGAATTIDDTDLTASRAVISNASGKVAVSGVTTTELNILDGATVTTTELNILDGNTTATSTTLADADRVIVNDDGTMKQVAMSDVATYIGVPDLTPYAQLSGATFTGAVSGTSLTLSGDLTVNGTTTTLDSTNTVIEDNLLELNSGVTSNANDSGIIIERGETGDNAVMLWDESADRFAFGTTTATADSTGDITYTSASLTVAGLNTTAIDCTGNISLDDDDQVILGTGNDFRIYHDPDAAGATTGANRITSSATGGIRIENSESSAATQIWADSFTIASKTGTPQRANFNGSGMQLNSGSRVSSILDEDTMSSNSATALATQQSIKAYVDSLLSNNSGSAPFYAARAWGTFDGTDYTGTTFPYDVSLSNFSTGNVSSIDRDGVGVYTINFTTAMPNSTYTFIGTINGINPQGGGREILVFAVSQSTSSVTIRTQREETEAYIDPEVISFVIFAG